MFQLNSHVLDEAKRALKSNKLCRIDNVFPLEQANQPATELNNTQFKLALTQNGQPQTISQQQLNEMAPAQRNCAICERAG